MGNISGVSVGLTTWKWLKIGVEIQDYNFSGGQIKYAFQPGGNFLYGFTPSIFLQPTIRISKRINVYGQFHLGYYVNYSEDFTKSTDYEICFGGNYFLGKKRKISINGEVGYLRYKIDLPTYAYAPYGESTQSTGDYRYASIGVHLFLDKRPKKKSVNNIKN